MAKITLPDIAAQFASAAALNSRFQEIEDHLNDLVFYRENPEGEPNAMGQILDMNGYQIANLPFPVAPTDAVRLQDLESFDVTLAVVPQSTARYEFSDFTVGSGSTTFTKDADQAVGLLYLNGVFQEAGIDYSYTSTVITFLAELLPADVIHVISGNDTGLQVTSQSDIIFNTVADMISGTLTNGRVIILTVGQTVRTLGYTTEGDGGDNTYEIVGSGTGIDNGGSFIDLNALQAKGVFPLATTSILQFGADKDGVLDSTEAIRNCARFIVARGYGDLYCPSGTYAISGGLLQDGGGNALEWQWGMSITGEGKRTTRFIPFSATSDVLFDFDNTSSSFGYFTVRGFAVMDDVGTSLFTGDVFRVGTTNVCIDALFSDITIHRPDAPAFRLLSCTDSGLENIYIHSAGNTTNLESSLLFDASSGDVNNIRLDNVHVENQKYHALHAIDASNINWIGGKTHDGADTPNISGNLLEGTASSKIIGVTFSTSNQQHIVLADSAALNSSDGNIIDGCSFGNTNGTASAIRLLGAAENNTISTCYFKGDINGDAADFASTGTKNVFNVDNVSEVSIPDIRIPGFTVTSSVSVEGNVTAEGYVAVDNGGELTIAAGVITATSSYHTVDTEGDAATDDLDTINGGVDAGQLLVISPQSGARDVVAKDGVGNLRLSADFTMSGVNDTLTLIYTGVTWNELSRSSN